MSTFTLLILYLAYTKIIKSKFLEKQLGEVLDLIIDIQKQNLTYIFVREDGYLNWSNFTLFEVSCFSNPENFNHVYEIENTFPNLSIINRITNPLIPKPIKRELFNFTSKHSEHELFENLSVDKKSFVLICNSIDEFQNEEKNDKYISISKYSDSKAYESWDKFIECANNLKVSIERWMKKNGIKDLSLSTFNINIYKGKNYKIF